MVDDLVHAGGMRIGVISDTHGLLRPEALAALQGVELIVHAGDVGEEAILEALETIAKAHVVRGNVDIDPWCQRIPLRVQFLAGGCRITMAHREEDVDVKQGLDKVQVAIFGHSHRPGIQWRGKVLYLNPGSAGPRRFKLPVTVALLEVGEGQARAELVELVV
jgi:putative phosphoesterase